MAFDFLSCQGRKFFTQRSKLVLLDQVMSDFLEKNSNSASKPRFPVTVRVWQRQLADLMQNFAQYC